jgi:hypothetical protein
MQASLTRTGSPRPLPVAGPRPLCPLTPSAETYRPGGVIQPAGGNSTRLAALTRMRSWRTAAFNSVRNAARTRVTVDALTDFRLAPALAPAL